MKKAPLLRSRFAKPRVCKDSLVALTIIFYHYEKEKKTMKKLIPALAMLLIAAVMLGASTYAWFSMNTRVTVTGLAVKTRVSSNLFVASTTMSATGHASESSFNSYLNGGTEATLLEPVSTVDGLNFFYTDAKTNVQADGAPRTATYTAYNTSKAAPTSEQLTAFVNANGATGSVGYVDYVMELKAVNADATDAVSLKLTKLDLVYNGLPTSEKAFRVAVFMEKHDGSAYTAVSPETLPAASSIFSESGATYFTSGSAVKTTSSVDSVLTQNSAVSVNVAAGATEYYKVVVRIWLEGEDSTCNNDTFASLTQNWVLDLAFELDTAAPAVTQLGTTAVASTASGAVGTVTLTDGKLSNGETPVTYAWKNADGTAASGTNNAASYTATTSGVYYCVITTVGNTYYTDGMTLTVTP